MKRMAIFVEGYTEALFVSKLISEIGGRSGLRIHSTKRRGRRGNRGIIAIRGAAPPNTTHYALVVDCGGDAQVKSDVVEQYDSLCGAGYSSIVGIRDVYPDFLRVEVPKLRRQIMYRVRQKPVRVQFVLSVMEVEAWFIDEHTHFEKIHSTLDPQTIKTLMGFEPGLDDARCIPHPTGFLSDVYGIAGLTYNKTGKVVGRTIDAIDYAEVYLDLTARNPDVSQLVDSIDSFFA